LFFIFILLFGKPQQKKHWLLCDLINRVVLNLTGKIKTMNCVMTNLREDKKTTTTACVVYHFEKWSAMMMESLFSLGLLSKKFYRKKLSEIQAN